MTVQVEQALGWFNESSGEGRAVYDKDYVALFVDTIGDAVNVVVCCVCFLSVFFSLYIYIYCFFGI